MKPIALRCLIIAALLIAFSSQPLAVAAEPDAVAETAGQTANILSRQQWKQLDTSVERGLKFLASRHRRDGSFDAHDGGQPAITALCVMAFLSRGHLPGQGPYGKQLQSAIVYTLSKQQPDGLFWAHEHHPPHGGRIGIYNHGIAGLMLTEVYGMTDSPQQELIRAAIVKAIAKTRELQQGVRTNPADKGGWRYLNIPRYRDSDLSSTSWQLMFLRSARNAEFEVPEQYINEAMTYVRSTFNRQKRVFEYLRGPDAHLSAGVAGGGIVALELSGEHQSELAKMAGDWVLNYDFTRYNRTRHRYDRYHYGAFYCSQAMFQLGGKYCRQFFPRLLQTLVNNQNPDGSWQPEGQKDAEFGNVYTSALTVLALTPPYQLLPIYQR